MFHETKSKGSNIISIAQYLQVAKYIFNFFNASLWGALALAILVYLCSFLFGNVRPLLPNELISWILNLPAPYKVTLFTSILTIIGFLVAFHAASSHWRDEIFSNMKLAAAKEIDLLYEEANRHISSINIFSDQVIRTIEAIESKEPKENLISDIKFTLNQVPDFHANKERLFHLSMDAYNIISRYTNELTSVWSAWEGIDGANKAIRSVTQKSWVFVPNLNQENEASLISDFYKHIDIDKYKILSHTCNQAHGYIAGVIGIVKGQLTSNIIPTTISRIYFSIKHRKLMAEVVEIINRGKSTIDK